MAEISGDVRTIGARPESANLSAMQAAMWFESVARPDTVSLHMSLAVSVPSPIDVDAGIEAIDYLLEQIPILRTAVRSVDGEPQRVVSDEPADVEVVEVDSLDSAVVDRSLREWHEAPFALDQGPLIRFGCVVDDAGDGVVAIVVHHLVADMWALTVLGAHFARAYRAICDGDELDPIDESIDFDDVVAAEVDRLAGPDTAAAVEFWHQADVRWAGLELPDDSESAGPPSGLGERRLVPVPDGLATAVHERAAADGLAVRNAVLGAYLATLRRWSWSADVFVLESKANRTRGTVRTIGPCVNQIPRSASIDGDTRLGDLVRSADRASRVSRPHEWCPYPIVARSLAGAGVDPITGAAAYSWQKSSALVDRSLMASLAVGGRATSADVEGLAVRAMEMPVSSAPAPLTLFGAMGDELLLALEYQSDRFDPATIDAFGRNLVAMLRAYADDPDVSVLDVDLVDPGDRDAGRAAWDRNRHPVPRDRTTIDLIDESLAERPDSVAVLDGTGVVTYGELDDRVERLAERLASEIPGPIVGICLERSVDMLAAVLATWRAGKAFVPLDADHPTERIARMASDSSLDGVVTRDGLWPDPDDRGDELADVVVVDLDRGDAAADHAPLDRARRPRHDDLAYVMFTSGSTGRPKGVAVEHWSLSNFLASMLHRPGLSADDVVLAGTRLTFDPCLLELLGPLLVGGSLRLVDQAAMIDPEELAANLADVTIAQGTPTMWRMLLEHGWEGNDDLVVLCGGERMTRPLADALLPRCGELWNLYGPTETTVWASTERVLPGGGPIGIGDPVDNAAFHVLDVERRPVSGGMVGELWIGGHGVSRGYVGRDDLTAERFVLDPFLPGRRRMYQTGDLVRRRQSGVLQFVGRRDDQLKLRGHRIELGEIEAVLESHDDVLECVAAIVGGDDDPGAARLVLWYRTHRTEDLGGELRAHAATHLPGYMIPARFVAVDVFERTSSGKIDRRRLPDPDDHGDRASAPAVAPLRPELGAVLSSVIDVFREVLGRESVRPGDDFFELGGHSIDATRIASRLRGELGRDLPIGAVFRHHTPEGLAEALMEIEPDDSLLDAAPSRPISSAPPGRVSLSGSQRRIWFSQQLDPSSTVFNVATQIRLRGAVSIDQVDAAVRRVVARHPGLTSSFVIDDGDLWAETNPAISLGVEIHDHRALSSVDDRLAAVSAHTADLASRPFDLETAPLVRIAAHRIGQDDLVIGFVMHHVLIDQWAMSLVLAEFASLLGGSPAPPLRELTVEPAELDPPGPDLERRLEGVLDGLRDLPELPLSTVADSRAASGSEGGEQGLRRLPVASGLSDAVRALAVREQVSEFMVQQLAVAVALRRFTGSDDIPLGILVSNRRSAAAESYVGPLVNTAVIRLDLASASSTSELLQQVRERTLGALADQDIPQERVTLELGEYRSGRRDQLVQVVLNSYVAPLEIHDVDGIEVEPLPVEHANTPFDLFVSFDTSLTRSLTIEFDRSAVDDAAADTIAADVMGVLARLVEPDAAEGLDLDVLVEPEHDHERSERRAAPRPAVSTASGLGPPAVGSLGPGVDRSELEREIRSVWAEVLELESVDRDDDFFELGGHSLHAVRIMAELREVTGRSLPIRALFRSPTVAGLVAELESGDELTALTSVIELSDAGPGAPVTWFVTPYIVSAMSFRDLALRLPQRSIFAIQPRGSDDDAPIDQTVEAMATEHVRELKAVQPSGPYEIVGHCAGASVALEIVHQLQEAGDEVSVFVVADGEPPGVPRPRLRWIQFVSSRLRLYAGFRGMRFLWALKWQLGLRRSRADADRAAGAEGENRDDVYRIHRRALRRYRGRTVRGDLLLIRSEEWTLLPDKEWHLRWGELVTGSMSVAVVSGAHSRVLFGEAVDELAGILSDHLDA